ncbi:glycosyltransferase family 88 protein [Legionella fairfieldensis]|uniref:glycosyltransferase family 88 protein n=1 Tax=Legionella fairfieldensis TaxID=45064 RepID=UPI00048DFCB8|nr:glycosyltransferase family 88 protein [Legionella fairfieldensis]
MAYNYNPHKHVKVWLSKDSNSFMPLKNQLRLVEMRAINLTDKIFLIYDGTLLSPKALEDLTVFCADQNIVAKDVQTCIFPLCTTSEEIKLIHLYRNEIYHLDKGGNLAVASDILRWLHPVYTLGTYTDLDVYVNTSELPSIINVSKPFLFSYKQNPDSYIDDFYNNDMIAVVHHEDALPYIIRIQQDIYDSCCIPKNWANCLAQACFSLPFVTPEEKNAREVRYEILKNSSSKIKDFCFTVLYSVSDIHVFIENYNAPDNLAEADLIKKAAKCLRDELTSYVNFFPDPAIIDLLLEKNEQNLLMSFRDLVRCNMIMNTVVSTSGPLKMENIMKKEHPDERRFFSFMSYGLDKAFNADSHDFSWTETGEKVMLAENKEMEIAATTLQTFYRFFRAPQFQSTESVNSNKQKDDPPCLAIGEITESSIDPNIDADSIKSDSNLKKRQLSSDEATDLSNKRCHYK